MAHLAVFDHDEGEALSALIDEANERAYDIRFWMIDTADMLQWILDRFNELNNYREAHVGVLFGVFQVVTLNFAVMADAQVGLRKFVGIRRSWWRR
ncbi:hypothetical protein [Candidatus Palauibacter sp.]|uniref:hypothetical protein n=1 Tax=Candidatus Palauibacter sp. TaxID=3101350 RepID=UPI003CC58A19